MTSTQEPIHTRADEAVRRPSPSPERAAAARSWWRHPWLALLALAVVAWLAIFVLPTYVALDPDQAGILLTESFPLHYPILIVHVVPGIVALVAGCLQMWAWLRRHHPAVHRASGRIYVFGGVFPAALGAAALLVLRVQENGAFGSSIVIGNGIWAILWFGTTAAAFHLARQRRWAEHRRMMIYSFALTTAILWTRLIFLASLGSPGFETFFNENVGWLPWVVHLLIAQWWLNRTARRPLVLPIAMTSGAATR